jgi:NAD(P)-dependent dehydrogenase (short-subunit alcohol dehydrogenase family)
MQIQDAVAFVTGSNRGLGASLVRALKARGAAKIYAASRSGELIHEDTIPVKLDITVPEQIAAAAAQAGDTTLLFNNAGVNLFAPLVSSSDDAQIRMEMEVNYFGVLAMCRAFAPILAANNGGGIVNITSVMARATIPVCGGASASKAAAFSLTQAIRAQLAGQGTQVVLVAPGVIDTDMSKGYPPPKADPYQVAMLILDAIESGQEDVYPDDMSQSVMQMLMTDPKAVERQFGAFLP